MSNTPTSGHSPCISVSGETRFGSAPLLTAAEVAGWLGMSVWFVYDHGLELGLVKVGGANRYRQEAVEAFAMAGDPAAAPDAVAATPAPHSRRSPRDPSRRVRLREPATGSRPLISGGQHA